MSIILVKVTVTVAVIAMISSFDYLIIGNSAAAIAAVESIRSLDKTGKVAVVSDEPHHTYSRPLISHYLSGERTAKSIIYRPPGFYGEMGIEPFLGSKAVEIGDGSVRLDNGDRIAWKKMLLATGGKPFVPKIEGLDREGIHFFTKLEDAIAIKKELSVCEKAVVLGGGLIGMKAAEALRYRGMDVTVVELADRVLSLVLDEKTSTAVEAKMAHQGVKIILGKSIGKVEGDSRVETVTLTDGSRLDCDLLVVAIGVVPNTDLAKTAALKVGRGIIVNQKMESSRDLIYAAGDAVEMFDFIRELRRPMPVLPLAYIGGRVAGANMAGAKLKVPPVTTLNSAVFFGLPVSSAGIVNSGEVDGLRELRVKNGNGYKKLVLKDDRLTGFVLAGDIDRGGILFDLMRKKVKMRGWRSLLKGGLSIISLPGAVRDRKFLEMIES